ncbi:phage tail sheath family protein [Micromonospora endophytica]|uniref:phage tail sheath family protein n=1 Tax=Micromonospora endophytica TaxID=515350 RepID=UPI001BB30D19|nr:phage tail sheath subtilisin-like domain-containing protein [Micromonospora endophytica]
MTAFVGRTVWGPVDTPVVVDNFGEFERSFGGLSIDAPLAYSVRAFFLNGGGRAVVVRVFRPPSTGDGVAQLTVGGLHLAVLHPGAWGNDVTAQVDTEGITDDIAERFGVPAEHLFNLTVTGRGVTERFTNLTVVDGSRRVDRVLAHQSRLVRVDADLPTTTPTAETPAESAASGTGTRTKAARTRAAALAVAPTRATGGDDGGKLTGADLVGSRATKTGLYALEHVDLFNLLCIPPDTLDGDTPLAVYAEAMAYCASRRAVLLVDPPAAWDPLTDAGELLTTLAGPDARNAAVYHPRLVQSDPLRGGAPETFAPSGAVAGVIARTDAQRGIWKAPAGLDTALVGVSAPAVSLTDGENGRLNPLGINCLRAVPNAGVVVWGTRTLRGADQLADEYKYLPVRRLALHLEESLYRGCQWAVFEPNDEPLWSQLRLNIGAFLHQLFRQGAFAGRSTREAYYVKCDSETTTQADVDSGVVNVVVGFAPLKPAEFVVLTIRQAAGQFDA